MQLSRQVWPNFARDRRSPLSICNLRHLDRPRSAAAGLGIDIWYGAGAPACSSKRSRSLHPSGRAGNLDRRLSTPDRGIREHRTCRERHLAKLSRKPNGNRRTESDCQGWPVFCGCDRRKGIPSRNRLLTQLANLAETRNRRSGALRRRVSICLTMHGPQFNAKSHIGGSQKDGHLRRACHHRAKCDSPLA
jgi:hypothetical protein